MEIFMCLDCGVHCVSRKHKIIQVPYISALFPSCLHRINFKNSETLDEAPNVVKAFRVLPLFRPSPAHHMS